MHHMSRNAKLSDMLVKPILCYLVRPCAVDTVDFTCQVSCSPSFCLYFQQQVGQLTQALQKDPVTDGIGIQEAPAARCASELSSS